MLYGTIILGGYLLDKLEFDEECDCMKKKCISCGGVLLLIICIVATCLWYFTPKSFLEDVDANEIASISVLNGGTGRRMTLEDAGEISFIVNNIQTVKMKRGKISSNYDGYSFSLTFKDADGNAIDSFIINSTTVIRDDPFFYESENGELCFEFLQELENKYVFEE